MDTGFPIGNATNIESRALSGHDPCNFRVNLIGKRSSRKISRAERNCKPPLLELYLIFSYFVLCLYAQLAVAVAAGPARQRGRGWGDPDAVRD